ncbi:DeoR/GlpR family DNA-binding transcription regulator [Inquilinus sp.]|uniref:DeoR/GlpR family DNA-binding transcription regulator n=1 Tax=Inquilinus sp. TaxID=1932117 RepID=UPI0037836D40
MKPKLRQDRIVDMLRQRERVSVEALADLLSASRETIRRDLNELADRGEIRKFHGGATLPEPAGEGDFSSRLSEAPAEKRAIARAAAALFGPGDSLLVDAGTTTLAFAEELSQRSGLTVVTNCLRIAQIIGQGRGGNRIFVIGGEYRPEVGESVGALAVAQIGNFNATHAVLTIGGIVAAGAYDFQIEEAEIARAMVAQAQHVTLIADGSKLNRTALFQVCRLEEVDRIVVDRVPDKALAGALAAAGVEVIVA